MVQALDWVYMLHGSMTTSLGCAFLADCSDNSSPADSLSPELV